MTSAPVSPVLPFAELLDELRRHGFVIGLDQHLRMQLLLDRVAGDCPPERLKTHLAPIFATSRDEQERFHRIFDRLYPVFAEAAREESGRQSGQAAAPAQVAPAGAGPGPRLWRIGLLLLAAAIIALGVWRWHGASKGNTGESDSLTITPAPQPLPPPDLPPRPDSIDLEPPAVTPAPLPPPPEVRGDFLARHRTGTRIFLIVAAVGAFLLYEWTMFQRRRLVVSRERRQKPPFSWPVRLEAPADPYSQSAELPDAARLLRQREAGEVARLSVEETVTATIAALGFPTFRYRSDTRSPDYLLLIERAAHRDHSARLYQALGRSLEREGVHVTRYLHDGDPRVCYTENGEQRELLVDLRRRFPDYRVLLFSKGEKLVDQVSGRLQSWTSQFLGWSDRAILTPENPAAWGLREVALAQHFVVLPATTAGLMGVVGHFRGPARPDAGRWRALDQDPVVPRLDDGDPLPALQSYLGPRVYRWLCACAVYPELHWDLTLHFGSLSILGPGLISEENLLRLLRLPWFRQGAIPDDIRVRLIDQLSEVEERAVREAIVELLERNPAPGDSVSANRYELDLVVQRLALHRRDPRERRAALRDLSGFPRRELVQDFAMLKLIEETPSTRLQVLLPRRLRRVFYRDGVPALGIRTGVRAAVLAAAIGASWFFTRPPAVIAPKSLYLFAALAPNTSLVVGEQADIHVLRPAVPPGGGTAVSLQMTDPKELSWSVDRPEILSVEAGQVTALRPGEATVTADDGREHASTTVRVAPAEFAISHDSLELRPGDVRVLRLIVPSQDRDLSPQLADGVEWSVDQPSLVRITSEGLIEALGPGRVKVTARAIGRTSTATVTIAGEPVTGVPHLGDRRAAIEQVVQEYTQAAAAGNIDQMVALYPAMPRAVRLGYDRLGSVRGGISAKNWTVTSATFSGDSARVGMRGTLSLFDGRRQVLSKAEVTGMNLVRKQGRWLIASIETAPAYRPIPSQALAFYSRALLYYDQGDLNQARDYAERALRVSPVYLEAESLLDKMSTSAAAETGVTALQRLDSLRRVADRGDPADTRRYLAAFDTTLLQPTLRAMISRLNGLSGDNPGMTRSSAYALLRTYLVITTSPGKSDPNEVAPVLFNVWRDSVHTPGSAEGRIALRNFLSYSRQLQQGGAPLGRVDSALVDRARKAISGLYQEGHDELYGSLLARAGRTPDAQPVQFFTAPGQPAQLLVPPVGSPFSRGGWKAMQLAIDASAEASDADTWALGSSAPAAAQRKEVAEEMRSRYRTDYAGRWMSVLARTQPVPYTGLGDAARKLLALAGRNSQLLQLLGTVAVHTSVDSGLARQFASVLAYAPVDSGGRRASKQAQFYSASLAGLAVALEQAIRDQDRSGAAIDRVRERMNDAREAASAAAAPFLEEQASRDVARLLLRLLLDPVERVEPLLAGGQPEQIDGAAAELCDAMAPVLAMQPFNPRGPAASLDRVNEVFHPTTGRLWRMLEDQMAPYLIRQGGGFAAAPGTRVRLDPEFVAQINRAVGFSRALYPIGQLGPRTTFEFRPRPTDTSWTITLTVDDQSQTFTSRRNDARAIEWVGISSQAATLSVTIGSQTRSMVRTGTWAIFQLFREASGWTQRGDVYQARWNLEIGGRQLEVPFEINFLGGTPVFDPRWLESLSCQRKASMP